jgi:DnaJ-class molecular chaperone
MSYEPVRVKQCPTCGGAGLVTKSKTATGYEPCGVKACPTCHGAQIISELPRKDQ